MELNPQDYHSYLLRLWRVRDDGINWRASLEDVQTGELQGFARLTDLIEFLQEVTTPEVSESETLKNGVRMNSGRFIAQ
jgi:hypothetical protein